MRKKKAKSEGHHKGYECDRHYSAIRASRKCSCGRPGIGLDKYGTPVCEFHNRFPTEKVKDFPPIPKCPGPHITWSKGVSSGNKSETE